MHICIYIILPCTVAAHMNTSISSERPKHLHKTVPGEESIITSDLSQISSSVDISSISECLFYWAWTRKTLFHTNTTVHKLALISISHCYTFSSWTLYGAFILTNEIDQVGPLDTLGLEFQRNLFDVTWSTKRMVLKWWNIEWICGPLIKVVANNRVHIITNIEPVQFFGIICEYSICYCRIGDNYSLVGVLLYLRGKTYT